MQTTKRTSKDANRALGMMTLGSLAVAAPVMAASEPELMLPNTVIAVSIWFFALPVVMGVVRQAGTLSPCRLLPQKVCALVTSLLR